MTSGGRAPGAPPAPAGSFTTRRGSGPSSVTSRCQWCLGEAPERRKSTQKKEMGAAAAAAMPRLRCSPRGPALVRREESSALVLLTRSRAGLWFLSFFDSFLSLAATRPEISHRTRTALGELLPKGRGDTRATPRKKKNTEGENPARVPWNRFRLPTGKSLRSVLPSAGTSYGGGKSPSLPSANLRLASN